MRGFSVAALVAVSLLSAVVAEAQPRPRPSDEQIAQAREWFETGTERYRQGEWRAALEAFRRAYDLTGSPEILFNIGQCADRLRMDRQALEAFQGYVSRLPDAPDRPSVEARIRVLRAEIARQNELAQQRDAARRERERRDRERRERGLGHGNGGSEPVDEGGGVLTQWWFWTAVVVVIGGGIAVGIALNQENEPIPGSDGGVVVTLRAP